MQAHKAIHALMQLLQANLHAFVFAGRADFSRIISWYTKGGFVDGKVPRLCISPAILLGSIDYCQLIGNRLSELGVKHVSNLSYDWKYWEVLNEVTP